MQEAGAQVVLVWKVRKDDKLGRTPLLGMHLPATRSR